MKSVVAFLLLLALIGCGRSTSSGFVGTWRASVKGAEGVVTYREDGTFTQTVTNGGLKLETQGTYRISKSALSETVSKVALTMKTKGKEQALSGSNFQDLIGKTTISEFKILDSDTIETTTEGQTVKMVREK